MLKQITSKAFHFFWRGMAMGLAEVVPGVSGGTIAFITGIYERLIGVINKLRFSLLGTFRKEGLAGVFKALDGFFLTWLIVGMGTGVVTGVFTLTWVLEHYPQLLWAFFFGLIISSSYFIGKQIKHWNALRIILLMVGILIAYQVSIAIPVQNEPTFLYLLFCGSIAISALILPGISGSFLLLILGMYTVVIPALKDLLKDPVNGPWLIIVPFAIGCFIGLISISRVLSWTFKKYHDQTLAILTGIMIGSLYKLWPWRNVSLWVDKTTNDFSSVIPVSREGEWVPISETNVFPHEYSGDPLIFPVLLCFTAGIVLLLFMEKRMEEEQL